MVHLSITVALSAIVITMTLSQAYISSLSDNSTEELEIIQYPSEFLLDSDATYSLINITNYVRDSQFRGTWESLSKSDYKQLNFLTVAQGDAYMIFLDNSTQSLSIESEYAFVIRGAKIQLLNPTYPENKELLVTFELSNYDQDNRSWSGQSDLNYTGLEKFKQQINSDRTDPCRIDYNISLNFEPQTTSVNNLQIGIQLKSINQSACMIDLQTNLVLDTTNYQLQTILYCIFVVLVCGIQFVCVTKLCKQLMENDQDIQKLSLLTVGFVTVYDAYLCLQNLYFALLNYNYFQYFIVPAFFYFLLSTTCDMKLIWIIWRARYINQIVENQQMRRAITIFFVQFYTSLVMFFILMYFFDLNNWFILITSLFITPQIVHNALKGNNPKFISKYVFGILTTNIFYPLYFRGCPRNFRGLEPSTLFCTLWISLYSIQIFLLFVQFKFGPRSFVPRCLLPKQYNYFKNVQSQSQLHLAQSDQSEQTDDCAICLTNVLLDPDQLEGDATKPLLKKIMVTPCKHKFHIQCLKSWMDIKLQCPTCRKTIPPVNE